MSFKATTLFLFTVSALLALVKSAPASHSLNVRQYSDQSLTINSTNTTSTPTNTNATDFVKQSALAAQQLNSEFASINVTDPCQGSFYTSFGLTFLPFKISVRWQHGLRQFLICTMRSRAMEIVTVRFFGP